MNNRPVVFIDSGIGGLPYCIDFHKKNPQEEICYLADTKNFPYGPRSSGELTLILTKLTKKLIKKINPKIIVIACNTATIAAIASLRQKFPQVPFVGTVPALKSAAMTCSNKKIGVLGTERTIEEIRSLQLVDDTFEIHGIAAPELVEYIEKNFDIADETEKTEIVKKYIELFRTANAGSIVLGCTHFLFLQEEFRREAAPDIFVFDSIEGITKRIEFLLDENNYALRCEKDFYSQNRLILTGFEESFWHSRAQSLGFTIGKI